MFRNKNVNKFQFCLGFLIIGFTKSKLLLYNKDYYICFKTLLAQFTHRCVKHHNIFTKSTHITIYLYGDILDLYKFYFVYVLEG